MIPQALTVNMAINLRTHVRLTESSQTQVTINGQPLGHAEEEPLFAEALAFYQPSNPLLIEVQTDIPKAAGLGGSSVMLAALCQALACQQGKPLDDQTLLDNVTLLEHRLLKKPAGIQDAYGAIKGGVNLIDFASGRPIHQSIKLPNFLMGKMFMLYSDQQHHSGINNWRIIKQACEGHIDMLSTLGQLAENAHDLLKTITTEDTEAFHQCLVREAQLRLALENELVPQPMQDFCAAVHPQMVGKICGAGGGGCMLLFGSGEKAALQELAQKNGLSIYEFQAETKGVTIH